MPRALPALDGALDLARAGVETGGAAHNRRFVAPALTVGAGVAPELVALAHDPQTSGGLLAASRRRQSVEAALDARASRLAVGQVRQDDGRARSSSPDLGSASGLRVGAQRLVRPTGRAASANTLCQARPE